MGTKEEGREREKGRGCLLPHPQIITDRSEHSGQNRMLNDGSSIMEIGCPLDKSTPIHLGME